MLGGGYGKMTGEQGEVISLVGFGADLLVVLVSLNRVCHRGKAVRAVFGLAGLGKARATGATPLGLGRDLRFWAVS